ncbi:MAG: PIN-like domain-containing protein [Lentimicrobiaceae bacterium]|nr:PIN-like domain-containing protein [Lentimicrobiaceae bacterium]
MNTDSIKHYSLTDEREKFLWKNAIIVFDSSALLNFYLLPKSERSRIYAEIFDKLTNRLWMPFQVQYEYLKNREKSIINPISEKYQPLEQKVKEFDNIGSNLLKKIDEISRESQKNDKHPHIEQSKINEFKEIIENFLKQTESFENQVVKQIEDAKNEVLAVKDSDDVLEALKKSFEVGREYAYNEILEITKEGKHRYNFEIPPGYGDSKEKKGFQIFGDLIIWKQILEYSKENKKSILFITDDITKEEDWCYKDKKENDRIDRPREELIKEMKDYSNTDFWMYSLTQFLHNANKYLQSKIKDSTIQNLSYLLATKNKKEDYFKFKCNKCGRTHRYLERDLDLEFECVGSSERNMGAENQYTATEYFECKCGNDIYATFEVWEYPMGVHNYNSVEIEGADLIESFYFTIDFHERPDNDGFYLCHICDGNNDGMGNYVDFYKELPLENEYDDSSPICKYKFVFAGNCQCCDTLHIICPECKSVIALDIDGENTECESGCGLTFHKKMGNTPDTQNHFTLKLIDHRKIKCRSCEDIFVDRKEIGLCEKCNLELNFEQEKVEDSANK